MTTIIRCVNPAPCSSGDRAIRQREAQRFDFVFIDLIIRAEIQDFQVRQSSQWREVSNVRRKIHVQCGQTCKVAQWRKV